MENLSQHTKGEWILTTTLSNIQQTQWRCIIKTADGIKIAEAFGATREQAEANARLIASAPDMLEALKTCAKLLEQLNYPGTEAIVLEAIAKAEGKSKG